MYQPNKKIIAGLFAYCFLVKVFPFVLMHLGMDMQSETVYPWTFTPMFAVGIFGVALFRKKSTGFLLPLTAWIASDVAIGALAIMHQGLEEGLAYAIYPGQLVNYVGMILATCAGLIVRSRRDVGTIICAGLVSPALFFVVSNFGVWAFDGYINFPKTLAGLQQAYIAGLPFFKNSVVSTLAYSAVFFSPIGMGFLKANLASSPETASASAPAVDTLKS